MRSQNVFVFTSNSDSRKSYNPGRSRHVPGRATGRSDCTEAVVSKTRNSRRPGRFWEGKQGKHLLVQSAYFLQKIHFQKVLFLTILGVGRPRDKLA